MLAQKVGSFVHRTAMGTYKSVVRLPRVQGKGVAMPEHLSAFLAWKCSRAVGESDVLVQVGSTDEGLAADRAREFVLRSSLADVRRLQLDVLEHLAAVRALQIGVGRAPMAQQGVTTFERCGTILALEPTGFMVCPNMTTQIGRRREAFLAHPAAVRLVMLINLSKGSLASRLSSSRSSTFVSAGFHSISSS